MSKKYSQINDISTSKEGDKYLSSEKKTSIFDYPIPAEPSPKEESQNFNKPLRLTKHYRRGDDNFRGSRHYIINTEIFKVWHNGTIKCVSYHGIEYKSVYNPKSTQKTMYILFSQSEGKFLDLTEDFEDFNYSDFIAKINSIVNKNNVLALVSKKYSALKCILGLCLAIASVYLSVVTFFAIYNLILFFTMNDYVQNKYVLYIWSIFLFILLLTCFLFSFFNKIDAKKYFEIFQHFQQHKEEIVQEIQKWNQDTFSIINKRAALVDNFDYIEIKQTY